jgi:hypothetical protein
LDDAVELMNVEHFAILYAWIAREAIQRFGTDGEKAVLDGIEEYGISYGKRMAERAKADGRPNDFVSYLLYGEIDFSETGNEMQIAQRTPHVEVVCSQCGWYDAWRRHGVLDVGQLYCEEIDSAIMHGFNPDFKFEVDGTLTSGAPRCRLIYADGELGDDTLLRNLSGKSQVGDSAIRPFELRVAEIYKVLAEVLGQRFGAAGQQAVEAAMSAFAGEYGVEMASVVFAIINNKR